MDEETSKELQKNNWGTIGSHIDSVIANLDDFNLVNSFKSLLDVNVIRGKRLVVRYILKYQAQNDRPIVYAALSSMLNAELAEFGEILTQEATVRFIDGYREMDNRKAMTMVTFLAECFNYEMIHEIVVLQLLHILLENLDDMSLGIVIQLLRTCGKRLLEVSKTAHNMVFEKLREVLQSGTTSKPISQSLESLFDLRRSNYQEMQGAGLSLPDNLGTNMHTFMIDGEDIRKHSKLLGTFEFDPNFLETERDYEDWKNSILSKFHLDQEEEGQEQRDEPQPLVVKDMTSNEEIEFKKKIYLILKSSLSSDEAAHKIIQKRIPDKQKYRVVDIIIKSNYQEATYSKFYGLLSEKLCASHRSWKPAFEQIFTENYQDCDELEPAQLRTLGKFWGHLLASDYLGFEVFNNVHLNEEETNPPQRILLKFILLELVAELGIDQLQARFQEEYIRPFVQGLFPQQNASNIRYSINYFTAIGLGVLTEQMRALLTIVQSNELATPPVGFNSPQASPDTTAQPSNEPFRRSKISQDRARTRNRSRSRTPPRRARNRSITPPRRRNRSRSP
ncbi:hypothetical protein ZYGR_0N02910 [Zygosaccharomyces rouxii]|uniref:Pre-mRNA-splicing factor CWC22 n=2 Tax=Zygosaccharomyces rouxii TaxID=4956 RepID=C5DVI6_ZYGRC|nr:uncharacterized protein ZYRO0D07018g [Zygosaccharomyces rouxii]KAH9200717.1 armadillo-type protein [Zygosaccharomyces rouxii]GAV48886.1 hypothetical protein ZYGR_0N02910 [Zygosaccharomyces rouxii]CAR27805.1 ZYRO0D07018p [Zygosaccharomyces rouxii]